MNAPRATGSTAPMKGAAGAQSEVLSMLVDDQHVAIPVLSVQDVLGPQRLTSVPLSTGEIGGLLNLRGRIVTAIDLRRRLRMAPADTARSTSVVVEHEGELYSFIVDQVGEVLSPPEDRFDADLLPLTPAWRELARGIYRMDERLMILLDVARVLGLGASGASVLREDRAA